MFISISTIYSIFSYLAFAFLLAIIVTHLYSKLTRRKPLKLNSDSVVLIIGACTGIGRVMAIQIAKTYHSMILLADRRKDLFEAISQEIKDAKGMCECFLCDLTDMKSVGKLIESIKQQRGRIDFLLYNAGITTPTLTFQTSQEQLRNVMNVNFYSPIKIIKGLFSRLIDGHIAVVASSVSITDGGVYMGAYCASKHAIFGYLNVMRQELKKSGKNITLSIGCPYAINTRLFQGFKTKIDKILPILDEKYVGIRLLKEFVERKEVCYVGRKHAFLIKLQKFFPTWLQDWFFINVVEADYRKRKQ